MSKYQKRKGQKLIHNLVENWMIETGEIPNGDRIVEHLLMMIDKEFDAYLNDEQYTERQEMSKDTEQKQLEFEQKHPKTKNFYTKRNGN